MLNGKKSNSWTMEEVHKKVDMRRFRHNEVNLDITYVAVEHRSLVKSRTRSLQWYAGSGFLTLGSVPPLFYLGGLMISYPLVVLVSDYFASLVCPLHRAQSTELDYSNWVLYSKGNGVPDYGFTSKYYDSKFVSSKELLKLTDRNKG